MLPRSHGYIYAEGLLNVKIQSKHSLTTLGSKSNNHKHILTMASIASTASVLSQRAQECAKPSQSPLWSVYADQWDPESNPDGFVNVGVAENTLMHSELESYIESSPNVPKKAFTYGDGPLGSNRLRNTVANFLNRRLSPVVALEWEHVIVANGVSHSIEHTSWAFCNPGDGYLLGRPYYRAFIPDISLRPGVEV